MDMVNIWICELAFLAGGILYGCRKQRRESFLLRFLCCVAGMVCFFFHGKYFYEKISAAVRNFFLAVRVYTYYCFFIPLLGNLLVSGSL